MGLMRHCLVESPECESNDSPETAVRPFDAAANGAAIGEGGGLLILEEFEHAKRRGAKIYAELVGFGASQDSYSVTEPDPTGHSYAPPSRRRWPKRKYVCRKASDAWSRTAWAFSRTTPLNWPG